MSNSRLRRIRLAHRRVESMGSSRRGDVCARARRWLLTGTSTLIVASLVAFHAVLLWQRVLTQSLFEPLPALRWLATVGLLVGLFRLRSQGVSLVRGRRALVFWLVVLLLHVSVGAPAGETGNDVAGLGADTLPVLPAATIVLLSILSSLYRRVSLALRRGSLISDLPGLGGCEIFPSYALQAGFLPCIASRPPPVF